MSRDAEKRAYEQAVAEDARAAAARAQSSVAQSAQIDQRWNAAMRQQAAPGSTTGVGIAVNDAQSQKRVQQAAYEEKRRQAQGSQGASSQPYNSAPAPIRAAPALPNQLQGWHGPPAVSFEVTTAYHPPEHNPPSLPLGGMRPNDDRAREEGLYAPRLSSRISPVAPSGAPDQYRQQSNYAADLRAQMDAKAQRDQSQRDESRRGGGGGSGGSGVLVGDSHVHQAHRGAQSTHELGRDQRQDQQSNYAADLRAQMDAKAQRDKRQKDESRHDGGVGGGVLLGASDRQASHAAPSAPPGRLGDDRPHQKQGQQSNYAAELRAQMDANAQRDQRQRNESRYGGGGGGGVLLGDTDKQAPHAAPGSHPGRLGNDRPQQQQGQQLNYAADLRAQMDAKAQRDLRQKDESRYGCGGGGGILFGESDRQTPHSAPGAHPGRLGNDRLQQQGQQLNYAADLRAQMDAKAQRDQGQKDESRYGAGGGGTLLGDSDKKPHRDAPSVSQGRLDDDRSQKHDQQSRYAADLRAQMDVKAQRDQNGGGGGILLGESDRRHYSSPPPQQAIKFGRSRPQQQDPSYAADLRAQMEEKKRREQKQLEAEKPWLAEPNRAPPDAGSRPPMGLFRAEPSAPAEVGDANARESSHPPQMGGFSYPTQMGGSSYPPQMGHTGGPGSPGQNSGQYASPPGGAGRRGRGLAEINETVENIEEKSRKADAWSKVISDQIEERKRQKELDKRKVIEDERNEEARLERERVKIAAEQLEEQKLEKKRAEDEKLKLDLVKQIAESKIRAEEERKKEKDLRDGVVDDTPPKRREMPPNNGAVPQNSEKLNRTPIGSGPPLTFPPIGNSINDQQAAAALRSHHNAQLEESANARDAGPTWPRQNFNSWNEQQPEQNDSWNQQPLRNCLSWQSQPQQPAHQVPQNELTRLPRHQGQHTMPLSIPTLPTFPPGNPPWNDVYEEESRNDPRRGIGGGGSEGMQQLHPPPFGIAARRGYDEGFDRRDERSRGPFSHSSYENREVSHSDEKWHLEKEVERLRMEASRLKEEVASLRPAPGQGSHWGRSLVVDEKRQLEMEVERLRVDAARAREEMSARAIESDDWRQRTRLKEKRELEADMDQLRAEASRFREEALALRAAAHPPVSVAPNPIFGGVEDVGSVWRRPVPINSGPSRVPNAGSLFLGPSRASNAGELSLPGPNKQGPMDSLGFLPQAAQQMQAALLSERRQSGVPSGSSRSHGGVASSAENYGDHLGTIRGDSKFVGFSVGDDETEGDTCHNRSQRQDSDFVAFEPLDVGANAFEEDTRAPSRDSFNLSGDREAALVSETQLVSFGVSFTPQPDRQQAKLRYNQLQAEVQRRKAEQIQREKMDCAAAGRREPIDTRVSLTQGLDAPERLPLLGI